MGYTTDFSGEFEIEPPLDTDQVAYLNQFATTRRMCRHADRTAMRPDPLRVAVGLPVGPEGAYFVNAGGMCGQELDAPDVRSGNNPPVEQPGLWCQWVPSEDGATLGWDGNEKFYDYVEWLGYIVTHFLKPWGRVLNGSVDWAGEDSSDRGTIFVKDNQIVAVEAPTAKSPFEDEEQTLPAEPEAPQSTVPELHALNCPASGSITGICNCGTGR